MFRFSVESPKVNDLYFVSRKKSSEGTCLRKSRPIKSLRKILFRDHNCGKLNNRHLSVLIKIL